MRKLTYENSRGETVSFAMSPVVLEKIAGISESGAEVQGQKSPYADGETYIDTLLEPRSISIEGAITRDLEQHRRYILRVCNPKLGLGKITYEDKGLKRQIYGALEGVPSFPDRERDPFQRFIINWICPNPYWMDETDNKVSLAAYRQSLLLPFTLPALMGVEGQSSVIFNDGDVDAPMKIEFHGPSVNPQLINETTGEFIKVYRELRADEKLVINTAHNEKRVEIIKNEIATNAYGFVDWFESSFLKLVPGENVLSYKADSGTENAVVNLSYRNQYVGV